MLARGEVRLFQEDRKAWADELDYDDDKELAVLTGDVRVETDDGGVLTGTKVAINLSSDEAVVYGPTYAEFVLESDSSTTEDDK
jgi:lipopolysaccharide export system protein LptA